MQLESRRLEYDGAELIVRVPMDPYTLARYHPESVTVAIHDGEKISPRQRGKIWALINEIAMWEGEYPKDHRFILQARFVADSWETTSPIQDAGFSLSANKEHGASMETARQFITWMIDFCLKHGIPCMDVHLREACEDIEKYLYACLLYKRCAICGRKAELHHWDALGMGVDRMHTNHIGKRGIALCRAHHAEAHKMGRDTFGKKYKVCGLVIDAAMARNWSLMSEAAIEKYEAVMNCQIES